MNLSTNIYGGVIMDLITHMKYERTGKVRGIYWLFQIILPLSYRWGWYLFSFNWQTIHQ